jgi:hypothetical protein
MVDILKIGEKKKTLMIDFLTYLTLPVTVLSALRLLINNVQVERGTRKLISLNFNTGFAIMPCPLRMRRIILENKTKTSVCVLFLKAVSIKSLYT